MTRIITCKIVNTEETHVPGGQCALQDNLPVTDTIEIYS